MKGDSSSDKKRSLPSDDKKEKKPAYVLKTIQIDSFLVNNSSPSVLKDALRFQLYQHTEKKRKIIAAESGKLQFVGMDHGDHAGASQYARYAVAIPTGEKDEDGNHVVEVCEASVFGLETNIMGLDSKEVLTQKSARGLQARNALGEAFGTIKLKQSIRAAARNEVDVGDLLPVAGVIEEAVDEKASNLPTVAEMNSGDDHDRPIPPYDLSATSPEDIYPFDSLITPTEQSDIQIKKYKVMNEDNVNDYCDEELFSTFVTEYMGVEAKKKKKDSQKLMSLLYITYLLRFRNMGKKSLDKDEEIDNALYNAPTSVKERLLAEFTEVEETGDYKKRLISSKNKDKLTSYILVLCLFVTDFKLDFSTIVVDLYETRTKITDHLKALGCTVESGKTKAVLKAPLQFPKPRLFKRN